MIPHGLNLAGHWLDGRPVATARRAKSMIGYFGRMAAEKGLHLLTEAFCLLAGRSDLPPLRLKTAGYMSSADRLYFEHVDGAASNRPA